MACTKILPSPELWSEGRTYNPEYWAYHGSEGCITDTPGKRPPERVSRQDPARLEPYRIGLFRCRRASSAIELRKHTRSELGRDPLTYD
jgi:hypothetical protein